jgi:mycofactocin system glycosyltransferase
MLNPEHPGTYCLQPGVTLDVNGEDAVLLCEKPLQALRLNASALRLLRQIDGRRPLSDAAVAAGLGVEEAQSFLDVLTERGVALRRPGLPTLLPVVSVVVPVLNRPDDLVECVQSLLALEYPADRLEIIVVDDASDEDIRAVTAGLPVRVIRQARKSGPAACRNVGTRAGRGKILAYTDSDCVVDPDWLVSLLPYLNDRNVGAVGGLIVPYSLKRAIDRYEAVNSPLYMGREEGEVRPNSHIPFLPTASLLVRRAIWQELGGFDERFPIGEDVDLVWRVRDAGYRVHYVPRGRVRHKYRATLRAFARRRAFYGGSEAFLLHKHTDKPKALVFGWSTLALLVPLVAAVLTGWYPLAAFGALAPLLDLVRRALRIQHFGASVPFAWIARALLRDYAAFFYHLCGNFARYYSIPFLLLGMLFPPLLFASLLALLYPVAYDWTRRRPRLNFPAFLFLYWLELFAHQVGILLRCLESRALGVLVPRLVFIQKATR